MRTICILWIGILVVSATGGASTARADEQDDEAIRVPERHRAARTGPARTPPEVREVIEQVRSKKYLSASYNSFELLESGDYPEHEVRLRYYLAESLYRQDLLHSAQVEFIRVARDGPGTYHAPALTRLVQIWHRVGDPTALAQLAGEIDPDDFPSRVRVDLMYLRGRRAFDAERYEVALEFLDQVDDRADHYLQARYVEAVIRVRQGRLQQAADGFLWILRAKPRHGDPAEIERVRHLAWLDLGRIYYSVERYDEAADTFFEQLPRDSEYWPQALFEASWAHARTEDRESRALGHIMTLESPFFADNHWEPEAQLLEGFILYSLCQYDRTWETLDAFDAAYAPVAEDLRSFVQPYADRDLPPEHAYRRIYGRDSDDASMFPASIFGALERDRTFLGPHQRVLWIEAEIEQVRRSKPRWRDSAVGEAVLQRLHEDRERMMRRAGIVLVNDLHRVHQNLGSLMAQAELLRLEAVSGQRLELTRMAADPDAVDVAEQLEKRYATDPEYVYWPFSGEYWQDELGYYRPVVEARCTH